MRFLKIVFAAFLLLMPGYAVAQAITGRTVTTCLQDSWPVGENHYIEITTTGGVCLGNTTFASTQSGTWTVQPGNTPNTTPWLTQSVPATGNGLIMSSVISLATTNTNLVSTAAAHNLYHIGVFNNSTAIAYLKFYDTATAPTCGSGTPVKRIMVPGNTNGAGVVMTIPSGLSFTSGIGFCLTGGIGDSDTTSVAANQFIVNLDFK